jgi:hypothetical protein
MPEYEPRGCPRGASFSWYTYSPLRLKYPYVRGGLLKIYREVRERLGDPVDAWAEVLDAAYTAKSPRGSSAGRRGRRRYRARPGSTSPARSSPRRRIRTMDRSRSSRRGLQNRSQSAGFHRPTLRGRQTTAQTARRLLTKFADQAVSFDLTGSDRAPGWARSLRQISLDPSGRSASSLSR